MTSKMIAFISVLIGKPGTIANVVGDVDGVTFFGETAFK